LAIEEGRFAMSAGNKKSGGDAPIPEYGVFKSPIGPIWVAVMRGKMIALDFTAKSEAAFRRELEERHSGSAAKNDAAVRPVIRQLKEYFSGKRKKFDLPLDISGLTRFQEKVLKAAQSIPYGETRSYGWLAKRGGSPRAARAVGQVMARNPIPIVIPCHRVIGSNGGLCGFAGELRALDLKSKLLAVEGIKDIRDIRA
jgi:methylated-DNA-[protein]-cysteine S-methyltransferase